MIVSDRSLVGVLKVSRGRVSGRCLIDVIKVSGRGLEGVWMVSEI